MDIDINSLKNIEHLVSAPLKNGVDEEFSAICMNVMNANDKHFPHTSEEASLLYGWLVDKLSPDL